MAKMSESVKKMLNEFMELHENGYTINEIAKKFSLSASTVYSYLQEIAQNNGVTRESLLCTVHKQHVVTKEHPKYEKILPEDLNENFSNMLKEVDTIISKIDSLKEDF